MTRDDSSEMGLVDHLTDLRSCLMWALMFITLGFLVSWFGLKDTIINYMKEPICPYLDNDTCSLKFFSPMDMFIAHIKLAVVSGMIISLPGWLYQVWRFVAPGLYKNEKKYALAFIFFGSILFLSGAAFVYYVVYPLAFEFLLTFGETSDTPMIGINEYFGFFTTTTLAFGLVFELPLILTILGMMGIVSADFLAEKRRYAIVVLAIASAMFTPPDILSMLLMLVPLTILYELSIVLVRIFEKKARLEDE